MKSAAVFIDGGYLDAVLSGARIDYGRLSQSMADGAEVVRTYYYHCPRHEGDFPSGDDQAKAEGQSRFFEALTRLPRYQVRLGQLAFRGQTESGTPIWEQKRVDVMMALDMVQLAMSGHISALVLVTGDSDLLPAVERVKEHGVLTVLWHGELNTVHRELWDLCDERRFLTRDMIQGLRRTR